MTSTVLGDYSFQGEWDESIQKKLKVWCAKHKDFLEEMEFDESMFEEFITMSVRDNKKTVSELQKELQDLNIDEERARDMSEGIGRMLKNTETLNNPALSRALSTGRSTGQKAEVPANQVAPSPRISSTAPSSGSNRLFSAALPTEQSRGSFSQQPAARGTVKRREDRTEHHSASADDNSGFKKSRGQNYSSNARPPPPPPALSKPSAPVNGVEETIRQMERMNEVAKQSGFKNAQEMLAAQHQMSSMLAPVPTFHPGHNHDPGMVPRPMVPPTEPQRYNYFPQHHYPPNAGYDSYSGFHQQDFYRGFPGGRGGRGGAGRGFGRFGNKEWSASGPAASAPVPADAVPAPPTPDLAQQSSQPVPDATVDSVSGSQQENRVPKPYAGRGGGRSYSGRGVAPGRSWHAPPKPAEEQPVGGNAADSVATSTAPPSGDAVPFHNNAAHSHSGYQSFGPHGGFGRGRGRASGRGFGGRAAFGGREGGSVNKVWVRKPAEAATEPAAPSS